MAMHDDPAMIAGMAEERFANPAQIVKPLRIEGLARADAGMDEKIIAYRDDILETADEFEVGLGHGAAHQPLRFLGVGISERLRVERIGQQRVAPAEAQEMRQEIEPGEAVQEHFLVIAGDDAQLAAPLQGACGGDHARAVRSAIHQVSQQDDGSVGAAPRRIVALDRRDQSLEQVQAAVDVADRIDALSRWDDRMGLHRLRAEELTYGVDHDDMCNRDIDLPAGPHKPKAATLARSSYRAAALTEGVRGWRAARFFARGWRMSRSIRHSATISRLLAASLLAAPMLAASPALAQYDTDPPGDVTVSAEAQAVTDYRFRGISRSGGDLALQGAVRVEHVSGFYGGVFVSTLDDTRLHGDVEIDAYAGWRREVGSGLIVDVGLQYYAFPDGRAGSADFWEPYASLSTTLGPATAKLGVAYAWKQDALGGDDNLYLFTDVDIGIPFTPVSVAGHLGYSDGGLSPRRRTGASAGGGFDWSLGARYNVTRALSVGASYVGVQGASIDGFSNDTLVGTLRIRF